MGTPAEQLPTPIAADVGLNDLRDLVSRCNDTLETLRSLGMTPNLEKRLVKRYRAQRVAEMVGFSRTKVSPAISELGLEQDVDPDTGRKLGYTLQQVNQLRDHLKSRPSRLPDEPCARIAVQSFKGGVAKSVTSVYLAQFLAEKGYRVLIVDCDPQASATSSFGFVPDVSFNANDTLGPCLKGEEDTLDYAIIHTYFDGVDLIPSCLGLNDLDFALFDAVAHAEPGEAADFYHAIDEAISTVEDRYDVIVMDSAPNLSMMTINILVAANAVLIPAPPALYDFASTNQYVQMVDKVMTSIAPGKRYGFLKVMASKVDRSKKKQVEFLEIMADKFGKFLLHERFFSASAIPDTASLFQTVFDQQKPDRRVLAMLQRVLGEVEEEICKMWPSKHEALRERGVLT